MLSKRFFIDLNVLLRSYLIVFNNCPFERLKKMCSNLGSVLENMSFYMKTVKQKLDKMIWAKNEVFLRRETLYDKCTSGTNGKYTKNELVFPNLYFLFFLFELTDVGQVSSAAQWLFIAQSK